MAKKLIAIILLIAVMVLGVSSVYGATNNGPSKQPVTKSPITMNPDPLKTPSASQPVTTNDPANNDSGNWITRNLNEGFNGLLNNIATAMTNRAMKFLGDTLFSDKDFTKQPALKSDWNDSKGIAYGLLLVLFMIGLASSPLQEHLNMELLSIREVMTRTVLAIIAVKFSLDIAGMMTDISTGMTGWLMGKGVTITDLKLFTPMADPGTSDTGLLLIWTGTAILSLILAVLYAIRDITIYYFIAYAPIFIVLWVLPQTEKYAKIAFNILIGMIAIKFIHAGMIRSFLKMQFQGGDYEVIMSLAMIILMYMIPGILLQIAISTGGTGSMLSRTIVNNTASGLKSAASSSVKPPVGGA